MKSTKIINFALAILLIGFVILTVGCQSDKAENKEHKHTNSESLQLNHGEKWEVTGSMMIHIRNAENEVKAFEDSNGNDYGMLAEKLQSHIALLTSNCTMKGQAHDELHKWLLPYISLVDELAKSNSADIKNDDFNQIKNSFGEFNKYFK